MTTQLCHTCQNQVAVEYFAPSYRGRAGQTCNPCAAAKRRERYKTDPAFREKNNDRLKAWAAKNSDRFRAAQRAHYEQNKVTMDRRSAEWRDANPDKRRAAVARWHKENPVRSYAHTRTRTLRKKGQTPDDADFNAIAALYELAARLTRETGVKHEVDHVKPLSRGGLHHQDNLRVITRAENLRKGARLIEELA
jgi:5-methylcytosine-specific restriction endonuclease McrA